MPKQNEMSTNWSISELKRNSKLSRERFSCPERKSSLIDLLLDTIHCSVSSSSALCRRERFNLSNLGSMVTCKRPLVERPQHPASDRSLITGQLDRMMPKDSSFKFSQSSMCNSFNGEDLIDLQNSCNPCIVPEMCSSSNCSKTVPRATNEFTLTCVPDNFNTLILFHCCIPESNGTSVTPAFLLMSTICRLHNWFRWVQCTSSR
mmetsp:Transcript_9130/g.18109  ORF Transcript_9130/g.18109 Transcript_9130/m.18109 type:complete len:205 (-) Transcript_9130:1269-1883(-)